MSQAVKIFVFAALAFLVYITSKGQLGTYLGFFKLGAGTGSTNGQDFLEGYGKKTQTITQDAEQVKSGAELTYNAAMAANAAYDAISTANGQSASEGLNSIGAEIAAAILAKG